MYEVDNFLYIFSQNKRSLDQCYILYLFIFERNFDKNNFKKLFANFLYR